MNYQRHYDLLIDKAKNRQLDGYLEKHHIVPRCLGGADDKDNLVSLTPEEHYVAHQLLVKMYPENDSLVYAANKMTVSSKWTLRNNKLYGWLRRKYQFVCKQRVGAKNGSYGRRWYHDPATLANGKFREEEIPEGWELGRVPKEKIRFCKSCGEQVDKVKVTNRKGVLCKSCKKEGISIRAKNAEKYDFTTIEKIYREHIESGTGYYTLAKQYDVHHSTIYDYIQRHKENLEKINRL